MATDVIIVGAGLSGLMAAQQLKTAGKSMTILDKGRSVGGRLASRRIAKGIADYGAQFFTARTDKFQQQVNQWIEEDIISIWGYGWSDGSLKRTPEDGHPRYIAKGGMNALAKHIASSVSQVQVETKVSQVEWDNIWRVTDTKGHLYEGKVLIMTPPVPQTLELIQGIDLTQDDKEALDHIRYGPCLCAMFVIDGKIELPEPGALQNFKNTVYWFADNKQKGISPDERIITMHVGASYSRAHYDDPDEEILEFLRKELQNHLSKGTSIKEGQVEKWRYSVPLVTYPHDVLKAQNLPLIFGGDAFGGRGRVEGAYTSGVKAGQTAIELL